MFIRFTLCVFCERLSISVSHSFPFGFEGGMWDLIVSIPGHCLSIYFSSQSPIFYLWLCCKGPRFIGMQ